MTEQVVNIRLSELASNTAERLKSMGYFDTAIDAARFSLGYSLNNYFQEFDPESYVPTDSNGSNYNVGSVDSDGKLARIIGALYPECSSPYSYIRMLMIYGLTKINEKLESGSINEFSDLLIKSGD